MSDQLATELRRVVDGAPPITLDELDMVSLSTVDAPRRRVGLAVAVAAGVLAVIVGAAIAFGTRGTSAPSGSIVPGAASCPESTPNLEVIMQTAATAAEVAAVRSFIDAEPGACLVRSLDRAANYEEFRRIFAENPDIIRDITPEDLPVSFRVAVDGEPSDELIASFEALPGVQAVGPRTESLGR